MTRSDEIPWAWSRKIDYVDATSFGDNNTTYIPMSPTTEIQIGVRVSAILVNTKTGMAIGFPGMVRDIDGNRIEILIDDAIADGCFLVVTPEGLVHTIFLDALVTT